MIKVQKVHCKQISDGASESFKHAYNESYCAIIWCANLLSINNNLLLHEPNQTKPCSTFVFFNDCNFF